MRRRAILAPTAIVVLVACLLLPSMPSLPPRGGTPLDPRAGSTASFAQSLPLTSRSSDRTSSSPTPGSRDASPCTACVVANIAVGGNPTGIVFDPSLGDIFVTNTRPGNGPPNASFISSTTNTVVATVAESAGGAHGSTLGTVYDPSNGNLYFLGGGYCIVTFVVGTRVGGYVCQAPDAPPLSPDGLVYAGANRDLYLASSSFSNVSIVNPSLFNGWSGTVNVGLHPAGEAYDPTTQDIFVANEGSGNVSVINASTNLVVANIPVGTDPYSVSYDARAGTVYVANQNSFNISVINASTLSVVSTIRLHFVPGGSVLDPRNGLLYVTEQGWNNVSEINTTTNTVVGGFTVGSDPQAGAYDPENGLLYFSNQLSGNVSAYAPEWGTPFVASFTASAASPHLNQSVTFSVVVDGGTSPHSYYFTGLPPGCTTIDAASWSCAPTVPGNYAVEVEVNDSTGLRGWSNLSLSVQAGPSVTLVPARLVVDTNETDLLRSTVSGGAPPYVFRYQESGADAGCAASSAPTLNCTPNGLAPRFNASVEVWDAYGVRASATSANISVLPALHVNLSLSNATPLLGMTVALIANASGGAPPYSYSYLGFPPGCVSINKSAVGCLPTQAGVYNITVVVRDVEGGNASANTSMQVIFDFNVVAPTTTSAGSPFTIQVNMKTPPTASNAWGPDVGFGTLTYTYSGLPPGCSSQDVATLTCTPTQVGKYSILIGVHDEVGDHNAHTIVVDVVAAPPAQFLGLPGLEGYGLLAGVVGVAAVLVVVVVLRARRTSRSQPPEGKSEARSEDQEGISKTLGATGTEGTAQTTGTSSPAAGTGQELEAGAEPTVSIPRSEWNEMRERVEKLETERGRDGTDPGEPGSE